MTFLHRIQVGVSELRKREEEPAAAGNTAELGDRYADALEGKPEALTGMTPSPRPKDWYDIGKEQGARAARLGGEVQRHQRDFVDEGENAAWIDGVLEGVTSAGGRLTAVNSVQDMMPGSKGGLIQVILVERRG